jgi:SAM-dependent methyltransferase
MPSSDMGAFWDRRARENPFYFVDNRIDYRSPDLERFWADGEQTVDAVLCPLGASLRPEDAVVEIGCGVGRLTRTLARRASRVIAVDVSEEMIALARRHNSQLANVTWLVGNGANLSAIGDATADACFSHVVFQHIPDHEITLGYVTEMGRVLRPGGWAAFQVSNDPGIHRPRTPLARRLAARLGRAPAGQDAPEWLGSAVALGDLRAAAGRGGMDIETVVGEGSQFCLVLARRVP